MTRVINIKKTKVAYGPRYVYIGRPTIWGNPFSHLRFLKENGLIIVKTRQDAVDQYRLWLEGKRWLGVNQDQRVQVLRELPKLEGKILGCYCYPEPCHGNVLIELLGGDRCLYQ